MDGAYWNGPQFHHVMNDCGPRPYPVPWGPPVPYTSPRQPFPPFPSNAVPPQFHAPPLPLFGSCAPPFRSCDPPFGSCDPHMHSAPYNRYPNPPRPPNWHNHGNKRFRQKPQKCEVDELSKNFVCRKCTKGYSTRENFELHIQSHIKCDLCEYEASPRAIKDHQLIHLVPDELKFSSPSEIAKWREERKKNYPTAENIAKKNQLSSEKKARGEVAVTPLHRYIKHLIGEDRPIRGRGFHRGGRGRGFQQRGRGNWRRGRGRGNHSNMESKGHPSEIGEKFDAKPESKDESDEQQFESTSVFQTEATAQFSSNGVSNLALSEQKTAEATAHIAPVAIAVPVKSCDSQSSNETDFEAGIVSAILTDASSVLCNDETQTASRETENQESIEVAESETMNVENKESNESNLESETTSMELENEESIKSKLKSASETMNVKIENSESQRVTENESIKTNSKSLQTSNKETENKKKQSMKRKPEWATSRAAVKRKRRSAPPCGLAAIRTSQPTTLLEKLLATEMRREHNVLLQCIRYTISQNFFDEPK